MEKVKVILLAPLDPVHDVGIRLIGKGLEERGYSTICLPPDITVEEVVETAAAKNPDILLVSRTIGYKVGEVMGRLVDLMDAAGLRSRLKMGLGGMAIKPELAAELGFDAGFGPGTTIGEVVAFIEGTQTVEESSTARSRVKVDITKKYSYKYNHSEIGAMLDRIADRAIAWYGAVTSPGLERARIREQLMLMEQKSPGCAREELGPEYRELRKEYAAHCQPEVARFYLEGEMTPMARVMTPEEVKGIIAYSEKFNSGLKLQHAPGQPQVFVQYGTGCPIMDIAHIKAAEAWGADGVLHFDPSWSARTEGLYEGYLTHMETGTLYTPEICRLLKQCVHPATILALRAHRGINTPEIVAMAGISGADMVKMNPGYGALSGGTDPERMLADSIGAMEYAARYGMAYDIPVGQELSGVSTKIAHATMLIAAAIGLKVGAKPILQPSFCYSPYVILKGFMDQNYIDWNAARVWSLSGVLDAPQRAGEPVAFFTHTEERVQSATATTLHAALAMSLEMDAVTIASTDEAYSGGPITVTSRIDTLKGVKEAFRFFGGDTRIIPSPKAREWADQLIRDIGEVLVEVDKRGDLVAAMYEGLLGTKEEGANPGRAGKGTVVPKK